MLTMTTLVASITVFVLAIFLGFEFGDLSLIYPIARGISPIIVTVFAFFWINERLS